MDGALFDINGVNDRRSEGVIGLCRGHVVRVSFRVEETTKPDVDTLTIQGPHIRHHDHLVAVKLEGEDALTNLLGHLYRQVARRIRDVVHARDHFLQRGFQYFLHAVSTRKWNSVNNGLSERG